MNKRKENGQALVILVFALVAIVAVAGLAIDSGRGYTLRRQAQNAADASAVAGARLLAIYISACETGSNTEVWQEIVKTARSNNADEASPDVSLTASYVDKDENELAPATNEPPVGATGVIVRITVTETTTLLKIVGQEHIVASTEAVAMAGPVHQFAGGGLLPIGFPVDAVEQIIADGTVDFEMFDRTGSICDESGVICSDTGDNSENSLRGWLNFNYIFNAEINAGGNLSDPRNRVIEGNMSNADVMYWAEHGSPYPLFAGTDGAPDHYYLDGDFVVGDPGSRASSLAVVCTTHMNQTVYLPVFDYVVELDFMDDNFSADEPSNPLNFPNKSYYHLVGFLAATLDSCSGSNMGGDFQYAVIGAGQISPSDGYGTTCNPSPIVMGVQLWR